MAFLSISELNTHLYGEQVGVITRNDDAIATGAIDGAMAEARGYLSKFDVELIFNATGTNRHPLLLIFVKDIAVWHLINLANPGVDYSERESRYKSAIAWFKGVRKGDIVPDLPGKPEEESTPTFQHNSNVKRSNHF